jgi:rod shape-determining protein MreD
VKVVRMLGAIVVALLLQTMLARLGVQGRLAVDLVLVVVAYIGLTSGPVLGIVAGTIGGLAQDSLTGGIVGIGGLAKTVVGFVTGVIGAQFIVSQALVRFLVFFGATVVHAAVVLGLGLLLGLSPGARPLVKIAAQGAGNALVGIAVFQLIEFLPGAVERRRAGRGGPGVRSLRNRG